VDRYYVLEENSACLFRVEEISVITFVFIIQYMYLDLLEELLVFWSWEKCSPLDVIFSPNSLNQVTERNMPEVEAICSCEIYENS
jgi:hypothetical protein